MTLPIITEITGIEHFIELLKNNPGQFIIKFGAEWCAPCKKIEKDVKFCFDRMPDTVQCAIIDIDEYLDLYAFLKTKKWSMEFRPFYVGIRGILIIFLMM